MNFVKKKTGKTTSQVKLSGGFPKKYFDDPNKTLKEAGITKNEALQVEIK